MAGVPLVVLTSSGYNLANGLLVLPVFMRILAALVNVISQFIILSNKVGKGGDVMAIQ